MQNKKINFDEYVNRIVKIKIAPRTVYLLLGALTLLSVGIGFYFGLVPLNFHSSEFRGFLGWLLFIWCVPILVYNKLYQGKTRKQSLWQIPAYALAVFIALNLSFSLITSPVFMAKNYRELINVNESHSFVEDVEDYTTMQIPVVDKGLAQKLGDKKLGEDNLGSQFYVGEYYMICHEGSLCWVAPIEFSGFFEWTNRKVSPGFVMINANDPSDVKIVSSQLKYADSAFLSSDLGRRNYFSKMGAWRADDAHLELTDEGEPRFVETVYTNRIGYTNGRDVLGIIVTDPFTGESEYYDYLDAPTWINHVLTEEVVIEQLNFWGQYVNGFFNTIFAKNEVLEVSTGINYVYSNGDMYLQTGMTSVGSDESIVGVMMVNMRTKESYFYRIGGATEYAAANSAIGKDQEKRYTASAPIMINMDGIPTYFIMLKDDEGLVKRYSYVNVTDYSIVATGETRTQALTEYKKLVDKNDASGQESYVIKEIVPVTIDGNTYYYLRFNATAESEEGFEELVFRVNIKTNALLPFLKVGDSVSISYTQVGDVREISALTVN